MEKEQFIKEVLPIRIKLMNYAISFLKSKEEAEDIIQEVYMKLWHLRTDLDRYKSVEALSFQITKHLCINRQKVSRRTQGDVEQVERESEFLQPDVILIEKDDTKQVMHIIEHLPSAQQAVLKMRHIDGLEIAEIAELTGSTQESIRMNLSRARKRVKLLFEKIQQS